jgi:hypothetical protein
MPENTNYGMEDFQMKKLLVVLAVMAMACAAFAVGDVNTASDTATVTLDIQQMCTIDITNASIAIVKTGVPGAYSGASAVTGNANFLWKLAAALSGSGNLPGASAAITGTATGGPGAITSEVTVSGTTAWTDSADDTYSDVVTVTVSHQ